MAKNNWKSNLLLVLHLLLVVTAFAQHQFVGQVVDEQTNQPVPFAKISSQFEAYSVISDERGCFSITLDEEQVLSISAVGYLEGEYWSAFEDSLHVASICLRHRLVYEKVTRTNLQAERLMHRVLDNSVRNDPSNVPHEYKTYNKFTLATDDITRTKNKLNKFLRGFSLGIQEFSPDHYLLITESTSDRKYKNHLKEKETITASKVSGIDKPTLFTVTPKIQPFSVYDFYLGIASGHFRSPLNHGALHDYNFEIADTIITPADTVYQIFFAPRKTRFFKSLKGVLYVNKKYYGIEYCILEPAQKANLNVRFVQKNTLLNDNSWFPEYSSTILHTNNVGYNKMNFIATLQTTVYDVELNKYFHKKTFGEVVYDFSNELEEKDSLYWQHVRKTPFTNKDLSTYAFYDTLGTIKNFENKLLLAEKLRLKQVPYKFLSFDLTKLLDYNDYEGLRIGMGIYNSDQFSRRFTVGGYAAFGFKDGKAKYGFDGTIHLDYATETDFTISYKQDVVEAGAVWHSFDKNQYSTEWLRRLKVSKMDIERESKVSLKTHPFNYFQLETSFSNSANTPTYNYDYKGQGLEEYHYTEAGIGLRYAFGEKYFQFSDHKLPLGSEYPVLWFKYTHGFNDLWDGDYLYNRYDVKVNYTLPIRRLGKSQIQFTLGHIDRNVPYFKMYNGKGNSEIGAVAHNGFETMGYNEFLSSTYTALYFLHDFGKLYFLDLKNYTPKIEFAQNIGFGSKMDKSVHQDIDFKTFEKGYFESGLILSNFVMVKAYVIKVGLGVGFFYRYGPYSLPGFSNNSRVKLSLEFQL